MSATQPTSSAPPTGHSVGIRALKQNASEVVARAAAGETIEITDRGRPVAQLIPLQEDRITALTASGRITRPTGSITEYLESKARRDAADPTRSAPSIASEDVLREQREDRL